MNFILGNWIKYCTKELLKTLKIILIGFSIIAISVIIKYKPVYEVTLAGKTIGYVSDKEKTDKKIKNFIDDKTENIAFRVANNLPEYRKILVVRSQRENEKSVILAVEDGIQTIYKTYAITIDGEKKAEVSSENEAMQIVEDIKKDAPKEVEMTLGIEPIYTKSLAIETKEEAENELNAIKTERVNEYEAKKKEEEEKAKLIAMKKAAFASTTMLSATGEISGLAISIPVSGNISSRFGERSSSRSSTHTGLDISAPMGTGIRPIAAGTVTFAGYNGSYGNLIKVDHGNGVESWYAHCSAIYASVGQSVDPSITISAVGSTGNSTGPHLHLEIRINGAAVNPQNYLYK